MCKNNSYELTPRYDTAQSFYGKAKVVEDNGRATLISYSTQVAYIENGKAHINGTYSATTLRHIREFLHQHGFKVGSKKELIEWYS